jgi:outer membrane protein assembly factor BamB
LKWKTKVGIGLSSPVVSGRSVFGHSREDEEEVVRAIDIETGQQVWSDRYKASFKLHPAAAVHGKGPRSTPAIHQDSVYTFGMTGVLTCYARHNGRVRWRRDTPKSFSRSQPEYGIATSPVVDGPNVIVFVGGPGDGALTAFDVATGEVRCQ